MDSTDRMFQVIGWTVTFAFGVTTVVTLLALTKVIELADPDYLHKLFTALVLEIVACGFFIFRHGFKEGRPLAAEQAYFKQASELMEQALDTKNENPEEADRLLGQILMLSVEDLPFEIRKVFRERGEIATGRELWNHAVNSYSVYYEIQPDDLDALINYGRALRETNRYDEALQVYERAKRLSPNNYLVLNGLQNISRRMAGFLQEAERPEVANRWFEETRELINALLKISPDKETNERQYLNAILARARLYWQWERYPETISAFRDIIDEFPDHSGAPEDLAAVLLEYSERGGGEDAIAEARAIYKRLYDRVSDVASKVFIGAGYAEAVALTDNPELNEVDLAETLVLRSMTENENREEDPYPFYAAALLFHKKGQLDLAIEYMQKAILSERRRSSDPYRFDYTRLIKYERLLQRWQEFETGNAS